MDQPKRRGRPTTKGREGEKSTLSIGASAALKARLQEGADRNGRSLSQEAELRLELSFEREELWAMALEADHGPRVAALMRMVQWTISDVGKFAGFFATQSSEGAANWIENPDAVAQVRAAVAELLDAFDPRSSTSKPDEDVGVGVLMARGILEAVKNPAREGDIGQRAKPIRARLGKLAARLNVDDRKIAVPAIMPSKNSPAALAMLTKDGSKRK